MKRRLMNVTSKVARQQFIVETLEHNAIESQAALAEVLAGEGFQVTQATLSRDLDDIGAFKDVDDVGRSIYFVPPDGAAVGQKAQPGETKLARIVAEVLGSVDHSGNIVVLRTPPGAAQYLASAIDHTGSDDIIGTVAGDDTVLLVTREPKGAQKVADRFSAMAQRRTASRKSDGEASPKREAR